MEKKEVFYFLAKIKTSEITNFSSFKSKGWGNSTKIPKYTIQNHYKNLKDNSETLSY